MELKGADKSAAALLIECRGASEDALNARVGEVNDAIRQAKLPLGRTAAKPCGVEDYGFKCACFPLCALVGVHLHCTLLLQVLFWWRFACNVLCWQQHHAAAWLCVGKLTVLRASCALSALLSAALSSMLPLSC